MTTENLSREAYMDCVGHFQKEFEESCYGLEEYRTSIEELVEGEDEIFV